MYLIVGLGNPGKKYAKTRHNVGFMVIDELVKKLSNGKTATAKTQKLQSQKRKNLAVLYQFSDLAVARKLLLAKPLAFMNQSGKAVKSLTTKYKIQTTDIVVVHDDVDLLFGTIRVSKNASSAGHKGVQSIIDELGTQDFIRVRIGIKPCLAGRRADYKVNTEKFVLEKFFEQEEKKLKKIIKKALDEIDAILSCP